MPDVLIRNVPKTTLDGVKKKAKQRGYSLQQQLRLMMDRENEDADFDYVEFSRRMRERIAAYAPNQTDSAVLIREDRDSH